ncbi:10274_t:CDS:2, partial [Racocetra persica]
MQAKVRSATSNDPWGPSGTAMNEIAQATHDQHYFIEIMEMIDKRLNDHGKNWRHVFKALTLLDYCLHVGSKEVVTYAKDNLYVVKTLREFQYIDDDGKDQGAN